MKESELSLEKRLTAAEQVRNELQARVDEAERGEVSRTQIELMKEKTKELHLHLEEREQDRWALQEQVEDLSHETIKLEWNLEVQRQELKQHIAEAQDKR